MNTRYLKQVIILRKDLNMPTGKVAAMAAHAAMTFIAKGVGWRHRPDSGSYLHSMVLTSDEYRWLTELDPGIEDTKQVSMAKIVCQVENEAELMAVEQQARSAELACHRVIDSGYSHNKPGTFVGIAIGPHWPEQLEPVTGKLKLYR
jgi:peptidyl-tRNA hydrolase